MNASGSASQLLHAGLVAEDRAARIAALEGIDREDGDAVSGIDDVQAEALDEGALADAWCTADADPNAVACVGEQLVEQRGRLVPMICRVSTPPT